MKIAILGIGGVGGYYGGKLAAHFTNDKHVEIIFIARGNHLKEIQKNGLKVIAPEEKFIAHPTSVVENPEACGIFDVLLVCVKTYDLENALELVSKNISNQTIIIPLMNGIDPIEKIKLRFPDSQIFQGCCYLNAFIESPGVVKFRGGFDQVLIGFPDQEKLSLVSNLFSEAGINVFSAADISRQVWEKFIFGSTVSSIGSLENESFGEIMERSERKKLLRDLIEECLLIANAKGIILENDFTDKLIQKVESYPFEARTSMQLDFVTGKRIEMETFTGYVVKCGLELKIALPFYSEVYSQLKAKN
jgi:2-dehydropantoate 2-reductase